MFDKKQYEKPVLENCGTMTEQTKGSKGYVCETGSNPTSSCPEPYQIDD